MKKRLSVLLLVCSGAAVLVRLLQQFLGFEAGTGLPVHSLLFALPLIALALVWLAASRAVPSSDAPVIPRDFTLSKNMLFLPVAGVFLLLLSGIAWLFFGLMPQTSEAIAADGTLISVVTTGPVSFRTMVLLGILNLILGLSLLPLVAACRPEGPKKPFQPALALAAPVVLVVRLVLIYRVHSVNPVISAYAVELLAMICLTLAFYRLAGFGCGVGNSRRFVLFAGWAVMLSLATLADGHSIPDVLFYLGAPLVLLGLLLRRLEPAA